MRKKVFCLLLCLVCPVQAEILNTDLRLLKNLPPMEQDQTDPYWDLAWHTKVAAYGDPNSQFFIAQVYEQGKLVPKSMSKAIQFYKKAAANGHLESCLKLAQLLPEEAEQWYLLAAEQNDPQAQIKLSQLYESQNRIPEAVFWFEKAMRFLFPNTSDLTTVSPDLKRLKGMK